MASLDSLRLTFIRSAGPPVSEGYGKGGIQRGNAEWIGKKRMGKSGISRKQRRSVAGVSKNLLICG